MQKALPLKNDRAFVFCVGEENAKPSLQPTLGSAAYVEAKRRV